MSEAYMLSVQDLQKWGKNLALFLIPVLSIYIASVVAAINGSNGAISLVDFLPDPITVGAMVLYILNGITDLLKKFFPDTTVA